MAGRHLRTSFPWTNSDVWDTIYARNISKCDQCNVLINKTRVFLFMVSKTKFKICFNLKHRLIYNYKLYHSILVFLSITDAILFWYICFRIYIAGTIHFLYSRGHPIFVWVYLNSASYESIKWNHLSVSNGRSKCVYLYFYYSMTLILFVQCCELCEFAVRTFFSLFSCTEFAIFLRINTSSFVKLGAHIERWQN